MLEDLTMIATLPVDEAAVKKLKDEGDKEQAAAGGTRPNTMIVKSAKAAPRRRRTKVPKRAGSAAR